MYCLHSPLLLQRDYLGNVTVAMDCNLEDVTGSKLALPRTPLQFAVIPNVAVRASALRLSEDAASAPAPEVQL